MSLLKTIAGASMGAVASKRSKGRGLIAFGAGLVATRIATRSLPGAALVGGALLAKLLYDRRKERSETAD